GVGALPEIGGRKAAGAVLCREVAHDRVRLPQDEPAVVDRRYQPRGVHLQVFGRLVDAVLEARVDALVLQSELLGRPQHLLHVDRVGPTPNLQHPPPLSPSFSSETYGLAVAARIARGEVAPVELPDELRAAELVVVVDGDDAVAAALQLLERRRGEASFLDAHVHALHEAEARTVARRLRALTVVGDAHHHLRVPLRLHGAAHHAEAHHRLTVARDEAGDDGLVRTLAGTHLIRMARLQHEGRGAVLQRDAIDHHARAEAHEVGLDERHHHAGRVGRGEVHGAALRRLARPEILRALRVDQLRPFLQVALVEQRGGTNALHVVDVGHVGPRVGDRELLRLDL